MRVRMDLMANPVRGEVWAVNFEPQSHKEEPGKKERPALIIQVDALNNAGHSTFIVIPGTSEIEKLSPSDSFPLRVRIQKSGTLKYDTDLLIDQVRAISKQRLMYRYGTVGANHLKRVEEALRLLTSR